MFYCMKKNGKQEFMKMKQKVTPRATRGIVWNFTLIELLMKYTCQPCNYMLYYRRE